MMWLLMALLIYLIINNLANLKGHEIQANKLYQDIYHYSYFGIRKKCQLINYNYSTHIYLIECLVILIIVMIMSYLTMQNIVYCLLLAAIIIFIYPYYRYLKIKNDYQQLLFNEVLLYASSGILFIQEKKNTLRILKDCSEIVKLPLKHSIEKAIKHIELTADFNQGLKVIEQDFNQSPIFKLHVLLRSAKSEGGYNLNLYRYLYQNIEDIEHNINQYHIKKNNNRKIFYVMVLLNVIAAYCFKTIFDIKDASFDSSLLTFYILNILTIIYYEYYLANDTGVKS